MSAEFLVDVTAFPYDLGAITGHRELHVVAAFEVPNRSLVVLETDAGYVRSARTQQPSRSRHYSV